MVHQFLSTAFVTTVLLTLLSTSASTTATASTSIPSVTIGQDIHGQDVNLPLLGAGTWQYNDTIAYQSVCQALQAGYTLIDTAFGYNNQIGVGLAIKDCWQGSSRDDLFVLTKLPGGLSTNETIAMHYQNLWELQLDTVDHLMVHFPSDWKETNTGKAQRQEQWKALEVLYNTGKARSIGISHYCPQHIDDILEIATVKPTLNQVEYHIGSGDIDAVIDKCTKEGIFFMSFSPLCGPCDYDEKDSLISGELVSEIASRYPNKSGSQVSLRFIVQQALASLHGDPPSLFAGVIPKSNNPKHIASNADIFDFELTQEDMERLKGATKPAAEGGDCDVP